MPDCINRPQWVNTFMPHDACMCRLLVIGSSYGFTERTMAWCWSKTDSWILRNKHQWNLNRNTKKMSSPKYQPGVCCLYFGGNPSYYNKKSVVSVEILEQKLNIIQLYFFYWVHFFWHLWQQAVLLIVAENRTAILHLLHGMMASLWHSTRHGDATMMEPWLGWDAKYGHSLSVWIDSCSVIAPIINNYKPAARGWATGRLGGRGHNPSYNMGSFIPNPHKRHPIARLLRRDMGCLLWVQTLDSYSASFTAVMYAITCYIGPCYNNTQCVLDIKTLRLRQNGLWLNKKVHILDWMKVCI